MPPGGSSASLDKASLGCYVSEASQYALVAQLAEHIHGKDKVNGSIPFEGWSVQVFGPDGKTEAHIAIRSQDGACSAIRSRAVGP